MFGRGITPWSRPYTRSLRYAHLLCMEECLQLGRALRYGDAQSFFQVYDRLLQDSTVSDHDLESLKEVARQVSELSNEDFSLLETSAHLPTISLPSQTIEAQLAAILERLRQEVYFSDSGTVSDLDGPCAWSQQDNLNSDLESEPDPPPQSGPHSVSAAKQHDGSCHSLAVGEVRQETCEPPVARQQAIIKKPDRLTARQPANQQKVTDLELHTKLYHLQKTPFDSTVMINHQKTSHKGKQRKGSKRRGRRKPCWQPAVHEQGTTTHCSTHPLYPDPEDRLSGSFNHKEVVHFLWQGWQQVQEELGRVGC